jgi:P27 family predicted phage terminase small subunit
MPHPPSIPPPGHLSDRAKALWRCIVPERATAPERLAVIQAALEALDRADSATELVRQQGMTFVTVKTGAVHSHPMIRVEHDERKEFARLWCDVLKFHHELCADPLALFCQPSAAH